MSQAPTGGSASGHAFDGKAGPNVMDPGNASGRANFFYTVAIAALGAGFWWRYASKSGELFASAPIAVLSYAGGACIVVFCRGAASKADNICIQQYLRVAMCTGRSTLAVAQARMCKWTVLTW